jgi:hypothetical protein
MTTLHRVNTEVTNMLSSEHPFFELPYKIFYWQDAKAIKSQ